MSNKAHSGGGISLSMHYVEYTELENTHIRITKSMFSRNTAEAIGGGIAKRIDAIVSWELNLTISETEFRYNSAVFGGATYSSSFIRSYLLTSALS